MKNLNRVPLDEMTNDKQYIVMTTFDNESSLQLMGMGDIRDHVESILSVEIDDEDEATLIESLKGIEQSIQACEFGEDSVEVYEIPSGTEDEDLDDLLDDAYEHKYLTDDV